MTCSTKKFIRDDIKIALKNSSKPNSSLQNGFYYYYHYWNYITEIILNIKLKLIFLKTFLIRLILFPILGHVHNQNETF